MEFKPLYFGDRLTVINPRGVIGVATLWSRPEYVISRFREAGADLDPRTSRLAVFGTLYGNGLREMLRNLLYNPQIQVLLICGHDRSGSRQELLNFFALGLEPVAGNLVKYQLVDGVAPAPCRIRETSRLLDDLVRPEHFARAPRLVALGDPKDDAVLMKIREFFQGWKDAAALGGERLAVTLPEVEVQYFPSNPRGHVVVKDTVLAAWKELLYLITRFGRRVTLAKGDRLELQHLKVVVEESRFEADGEIKACGLDPERLRRYQEEILKGELRPDETYHYGHRLRTYFGVDTLLACAGRLIKDPEDRKCYVALWDTVQDLTAPGGRPCLVSLYFRKFEDRLTLSAAFRTHNALDAWPLNVYGLMAVQGWVAARAGLHPGAITVISHSISIDPKELDRALAIVGQRKWQMRLDPMGYFRVTLDVDDILVEHRFEDVTLKEYRGKTAVAVQHQLARDIAISDINHGMYLGRQLARAEMALKEGREFVQD